MEREVWSVKLSLGQTPLGSAGTPREMGFLRRWDQVRPLWKAWPLTLSCGFHTVFYNVRLWTDLRAPRGGGEGVERDSLDP